MKKSLLLLGISLMMFNLSFATTRTVSNSPEGGAEYSSLQAVYAASNHGDTILVEGTNIDYYLPNNSYMEKGITFIGIGFNPEKQSPRKTRFSTTGWNHFVIIGAGSGSRFYGIEFVSPVRLDQGVSDLIFEDCKFHYSFNTNNQPFINFTFRNCVFNEQNTGNIFLGGNNSYCNGTISNCIFNGTVDGTGGQFVNLTIDHSLFLNTTSQAFFNLYNAVVKNCIFQNTFPANIYNSTFTNNLCSVAGTFPPQPGNGNTGSGNIENTDPLFVSYTSGQMYSPTHDYNLSPGSPAIGTGSDMTDIGVHGGYSGFSEQGEVLIAPIVRAVNILNTTVAPNGTLNVEIHATTPASN